MPLYDYECSVCQHQLIDVFQKMREEALVRCPKCNNPSLVRCVGIPTTVVKCRTLGALADKNASSMSSDQKKQTAEQQKTRRDEVLFEQLPKGMERMEKPAGHTEAWYKANQTVSNEKLASMDVKQKRKYIQTGKV